MPKNFRGEAFDMRPHCVTITKHTQKILVLAFFVKLNVRNLTIFKTSHMRGRCPSNRNVVEETHIQCNTPLDHLEKAKGDL